MTAPAQPIYLDNNATTPVDPRVFAAMAPFLGDRFGNPASSHALGRDAADAVEQARGQVAELLGAEPEEIIFTSGATEANNLALAGAALALGVGATLIVTTTVEHASVRSTCAHLARHGAEVAYVPVDGSGRVDLPQLERLVAAGRVRIVSVIAANNEIGTVAPLAEIGALCKDRGILLHTDAAQAAGKVPLDVDAAHIDLLSLSAHKFYGPKGVGALYRRRRHRSSPVPLSPLVHGGGQEHGLRPGTLNVPGIVGLGVASALARQLLDEEIPRLRRLRDKLIEHLRQALGAAAVQVNGRPGDGLPGTASLTLPGVEAEALFAACPHLCFSAGSACHALALEPSHVLLAIGMSESLAFSTIRLGVGRFTREDEVGAAADAISTAVRRLRGAPPEPSMVAQS